MIVHKRFQRDYDKGSIEVQVNFNVENNERLVSYIHIHSTFDSGLPATPSLEQYGNKTILVSPYKGENDQNMFERIIGNRYADDIVSQILELKVSL